ncbi:MAG TPA: hypothetical protein VHS74_08360 [Solirubrobacterales bacterium]|jgi:hypothetical protein|nr:hypothetical protein [Solirubrobacterales bacterium]
MPESPRDRLSKLLADKLREKPEILTSMRRTLEEAQALGEISGAEAVGYLAQIERIEAEADESAG